MRHACVIAVLPFAFARPDEVSAAVLAGPGTALVPCPACSDS